MARATGARRPPRASANLAGVRIFNAQGRRVSRANAFRRGGRTLRAGLRIVGRGGRGGGGLRRVTTVGGGEGA